jgi:RHS repeat-associated protein
MIAVRTVSAAASALDYILSDHLGSTSAILDATGTLINQQRYLPFGAVRTDIPALFPAPTDFGYTGQRLLDPGLGGLMDYKARFYSPYLSRFIQPDTLIPGAGDPQAWTRYSYVLNLPVKYNDPSGHGVDCGIGENCRFEPPKKIIPPSGGNTRNGGRINNLDLEEIEFSDPFANHTRPNASDVLLEFTWKNLCNEMMRNEAFCRFQPTEEQARALSQAFGDAVWTMFTAYEFDALGLGLGGSVGLTGGDFSAGVEGLYIFDNNSFSVYKYGGPVGTIGAGGAGGLYGIFGFNIKDSDDYVGKSNLVSVTFAKGHGATLGYFWSNTSPLKPGTPQGLVFGYTPGARLSLSYSNLDYTPVMNPTR